MEFGGWLGDRLSQMGWSGAELARRMRLHPSAVNKWTAGKQKPARSQIPALAHALGISEGEVWDALREGPRASATDVARLLDLPPNVTAAELLMLKHLFRGLRLGIADLREQYGSSADALLVSGDPERHRA